MPDRNGDKAAVDDVGRVGSLPGIAAADDGVFVEFGGFLPGAVGVGDIDGDENDTETI